MLHYVLFIIMMCYMYGQSGSTCLLNGASCPINVGRVVLGQVLFGASCPAPECCAIL